MKNKTIIMFVIIGLVLTTFNINSVDVIAETWENEYGKLTVYPDVSTGIITQTQYCNLTSYIDDTEIDVTFRFDIPIKNPDIWIWRNISHDVRVPDYGMINANYTLVNISNIIVIDEPEYVNFGDIPSNFYRNGTASFWEDDFGEWLNGTFNIGFDSFDWLNPEHTKAIFYYEYYGIVGYHIEQQFWFDWDNIKHLFNHVEHNDKHYYYVSSWIIKNQEYKFKWQYDIPLGSNGKWDLMFKLSSDPLNTWRVIIDPWWDSDWDYYKICYIDNKIDEYQMKIIIDNDGDLGGNVSLEGNSQIDFDDVRFVLADGNNDTLLPYWIESIDTIDPGEYQAVFWVNNTGNLSQMLCYYGNDAVGNVSDGDTTFDFFDDFETDLSQWYSRNGVGLLGTISATKSYQGSKSNYIYDTGTDIDSARNITTHPCAVMSYMWDDSSDTDVAMWSITLRDTAQSTYFLVGIHYGTSTTNYHYRDPDGRVNSGVARSSDWHKFEIRIGDSSSTAYIDETAVKTSSYITGSNVGKINYYQESSRPIANYIDCYIVRKFTSGTEPSWSSFGSEQTYSPPPNDAPIISNEYPTNETTDTILFPVLGVTIYDGDGDTMSITFYSNVSGTWQIIGINISDVTDGSYYQKFYEFNIYGLTYYWNVSVTDGTIIANSDTFNFNTESDIDEIEKMGLSMIDETQFFIILMFAIWLYMSKTAYDHNDTILLYIQFLAQIPLVLYLFTLAFFDGIVLGYGVMVSLLCASIYLVFLGTAFSFEQKNKK